MRAVVWLVTACMVTTAAPARGEPCPASSVMRRGQVAECDGVLVPGPRAAACLTAEADRDLCAIRLRAVEDLRRIDADEASRTITALEAALAEERQAGRDAATPAPATPWTGIAVGVLVGVLVGAGVVGAVWASR